MKLKLRSGNELDFNNIDPKAILLDDICWGLAGINRWTGQGKVPYYVSDHTLYVHHLAKLANLPPDLLLATILHDAHEAYTNDISEPVKVWLRSFTDGLARLQLDLDIAIRDSLGIGRLPLYEPHKYDNEVREHEYQILFNDTSTGGFVDLLYFGDRHSQADRAAVLKDTILYAIDDYRAMNAPRAATTASHPAVAALDRDKALFSRRQAAKLLTGIDLADDVPFMYFPAVK